MDNLKWWTRLLLIGAIVAVVLLVAAPLGYRLGLSPLRLSFLGLQVALLTGAVVFVLALIMALLAGAKGLPRNRNFLVATLLAGVVPAVVLVPQILTARSVPPIHDITTDTVNPPTFVAIVALRKDAANDLVYATETISHAEMAALQKAAYPDVKPLETRLAPAAAVARAAEVLQELGIEVVNVDPAAGIVEGTATTFWFGFKDDVVVRVTPLEQGSLVDVRSVSRVGRSDVGVNARRIVAILSAFQPK